MLAKLNCLIADDEGLAQLDLVQYVERVPFLQNVGVCKNAFEIVEEMAKQKVDLIFLDIQMPGMTGIEFLQLTDNYPLVIVTTAYPDYAITGYDYNIVDYLLKPFTFERFLKSTLKAKQRYGFEQKARSDEKEETFFFAKANRGYEKVIYDEILFVKALGNYITIQTETKKLVCYLTMKNIEKFLSPDAFIKISKSFIVAVSKIDRISGAEIYIGEHIVPIARMNKENALAEIMRTKLLKRK